MSFQKLTTKNVGRVLDAIKARCAEDKDDAKQYVLSLTRMLDELLGEDFFGTEGQLDPRGDHRD